MAKEVVSKQLATENIPFSYLDTDEDLTADSDLKIPSQKAIKAYVDTHSGTAATPKYVLLTSDFSTTSGSYVDVTGMSFTLDSNKTYHIHGAVNLTGGGASGGKPIVTFAYSDTAYCNYQETYVVFGASSQHSYGRSVEAGTQVINLGQSAYQSQAVFYIVITTTQSQTFKMRMKSSADQSSSCKVGSMMILTEVTTQ